MRKALLALTGIAFALAGTSARGDECAYEIYRPANIEHELRQSLPDLGVSAVPGTYGIRGLPPGRTNLLRGPAVVAQLAFEQDVLHSFTRFSVRDLHDQKLLEVTERAYPCPIDDPRGLCQEVAIDTLRDASFAAPAFIALIAPDLPIAYLRYGKGVGWYDFRTELWDSLNWLRGYLATTKEQAPISAKQPREQLFWALAADPFIAPYLGRLAIEQGRERLILRGVVPSNEVWDLILIRAQQAGFATVEPDMIIDTRTLVVEEDLPRLAQCLP